MTIGFNLSIKIPLIFILISVGSMVYYDVLNHGSFSKSVTGKWLKNSGILGVYQTVEKEVTSKLPVMIASVYKTANIEKLTGHLSSGFRYVVQLSEPVTSWIYKTIPLKLEYANDVIIPYIANGIVKFTSEFGTYLAVGQENLKQLSAKLGSWIGENINLEGASFAKVQGAFTNVVHDVQNLMIDGFNWAHKQLVG
ncbi:uncharacterized protein LOC128398073 [Panonychus citri]|uniref:uncharacterized protein LOC128398073 n=1 Tax=Panonychus citri TaxID=50023 RepID=UPI00230819B7|nr:uncharacterized protein LOC128398073 [Panonychus citri]